MDPVRNPSGLFVGGDGHPRVVHRSPEFSVLPGLRKGRVHPLPRKKGKRERKKFTEPDVDMNYLS